MKKFLLIAVAAATLWPLTGRAQDARQTLEAAAAALGATNLNSIEVSGRGSDFLFGQAYDGGSPWPIFNLPRYTLAIDFTAPAMRDDRIRSQGQNRPLGGGNQPIAEQRQIWLASGAYAWNMGGQNATLAGTERDQRPALEGRLAQIWLTPHGFIKAAIVGNATVKTETIFGARKTIVTFVAPTKAKFEGMLNEQNLVERIETWLSSPVLGDTMFEAVFSNYKDFNGVKFPTHIIQREGGYAVLDVTLTEVKPNAAVSIEVPANIRQAKPPVHVVKPEKLAEGLWNIPVDARDKTVAIEFRDFIVAVEAPDSEELSLKGIEAIKKVIPNKPIRYIVNTHTHFDHSGGLRTYVAEGATVITYKDNVPYYEQAWSNPWTIAPDRLAKSGRKPVLEALIGSRTITDGSRELVIYHYSGNLHHPGMLMVYLPKEKVIIEADSYNPPNNPSQPPNAMPNLVQWYDAVQRLRLDIEHIVPVHEEPVPMEDARRAIEAFGDLPLWPR